MIKSLAFDIKKTHIETYSSFVARNWCHRHRRHHHQFSTNKQKKAQHLLIQTGRHAICFALSLRNRNSTNNISTIWHYTCLILFRKTNPTLCLIVVNILMNLIHGWLVVMAMKITFTILQFMYSGKKQASKIPREWRIDADQKMKS